MLYLKLVTLIQFIFQIEATQILPFIHEIHEIILIHETYIKDFTCSVPEWHTKQRSGHDTMYKLKYTFIKITVE